MWFRPDLFLKSTISYLKLNWVHISILAIVFFIFEQSIAFFDCCLTFLTPSCFYLQIGFPFFATEGTILFFMNNENTFAYLSFLFWSNSQSFYLCVHLQDRLCFAFCMAWWSRNAFERTRADTFIQMHSFQVPLLEPVHRIKST